MAIDAGTLEIKMLMGLARLQQDITQAKTMIGGAMGDISRSVAQAKTVLQSLGVGLGVGYFVHLVKGSIDAMDHLLDLSKTTNLTVETLAGLNVAAKQSGGDLTSIAASINKLTVEMGKAPEKFKALGISAKDPLEAFKQLADLYQKLEDPSQRAAVMATALGKSWAGAAPLLAEGGKRIGELVQRGTEASGVTTEMAKQADELNDKWVLLVGTGGMLTRMIGPLLPLLNTMADHLLEAQKNSKGLGESFSPLLEVFKVLIVLGANVKFTLETIGKEFARFAENLKLIATGDWAGSRALGKMFAEDAAKARTEVDAFSAGIMAIGTSSAATAPKVDAVTGATKAGGKAAAAAADAFLNWGKVAKQTALMDEHVTTWINARVAAQKILNDEFDKAIELEEHLRLAKEAAAGSFRKSIEDLEFETTLLGKSNTERQVAIHLRALEKEGFDTTTASVRAYIGRLRETLDVQEQFHAQVIIWNQMGDVAGNFFGDLVMRGKSAFDSLKQQLKSFLQDLIALVAKKWLLSIAASVVGGSTGSAIASAGANAGANSLVGAAGSAIGSYIGGAGTMIGGAYGAAEGFAMGWGSGMAGAGAGLAESAGAWLSTLGATGWGLIIVAAVAVIAAFIGQHKGGEKWAGSFMGEIGPTGAVTPYGVPGSDNARFFTPNQADAQVRAAVEATGKAYRDSIAALGGSAQGFRFGLGFEHDPQGTAQSRVSSMIMDAAGKILYRAQDVQMDDKEVGARLQLESSRMILAALQASELPAYLSHVFDNLVVSSATQEQIDNAMKQALALKNIFDIVSHNPLEDVATAMDQSQNQLRTAMDSNEAAIRRVMKAYDGTLGTTQNLEQATLGYYNSQMQLLVGIRQVGLAIDEMFDATFRNIELAGMSKQQQYEFYQAEAARLQEEALMATDPQQIQALASKINADIQAAFGLLTPEQQMAQSGEYLTRGRAAQEQIAAHVLEIQREAADATKTMLAELKTLIGANATNTEKNALSADKQLEASVNNSKPRRVDISVRDDRVTAVVNDGG